MDEEDITTRIVAFLRNVGIAVEETALADDGFLPAMVVREGTLFYDPSRSPFHPGDLLHEGGHLAVTDPALRPTTTDFGGFQSAKADEGAAMCWSYAAALAAGIDPRVVFHDHGYKGEGAQLAGAYASGRHVGLPMLQLYGLAARPGEDHPPFPAMKRWLR